MRNDSACATALVCLVSRRIKPMCVKRPGTNPRAPKRYNTIFRVYSFRGRKETKAKRTAVPPPRHITLMSAAFIYVSPPSPFWTGQAGNRIGCIVSLTLRNNGGLLSSFSLRLLNLRKEAGVKEPVENSPAKRGKGGGGG